MINNKSVIIKNFDSASLTYDDSCEIQNQICEQTIKELLNYKNSFAVISDFACGTGESTHQLQAKVQHELCLGIDFSHKLLAIAHNKLPKTQCILADYDHPIFKPETVDLIFCNMGLQWSSNLSHTLSLFCSYLKTNGIIAFSLPIFGNFPEINTAYKLIMPRHSHLIQSMVNANFELLSYKNFQRTEIFPNAMEALRSIKKIGAHTFLQSNKSNKLSKSALNYIFVQQNTSTLTYVIGIYIAKKCDR